MRVHSISTHAAARPSIATRRVKVGRPTGLASTLQDQWKDALLFRDLATLRIDRSLVSGPAQLEWHGPTDSFSDLCRRIEGDNLPERAAKLSAKRAP